MYLYQAFNLRMQLISIFQRQSWIYREFVWKALIKSKTLEQIYFMSQVFQKHSHCYDKRKKQENQNYKNLFIFAATPFLSGRGLLQHPTPPTFFMAKIFNFFFLDIWVSGQRVGKWIVRQS